MISSCLYNASWCTKQEPGQRAQRREARLDFQRGVHRIPRLSGLADAGIAQLVEHDLAKVGVASSSLVSRSKFKKLQNRVSELGE